MNKTPVFKKGVHNDPSNYKPISLTGICCKTLKHIFHSIMEHLSSNNIINDNQHRVRSGHSCQMSLVSLIEHEDIPYYALDNHLQVDLVLLDFKAFDRVPHKRLTQKLSPYGINNCTYQWIETWLT